MFSKRADDGHSRVKIHIRWSAFQTECPQFEPRVVNNAVKLRWCRNHDNEQIVFHYHYLYFIHKIVNDFDILPLQETHLKDPEEIECPGHIQEPDRTNESRLRNVFETKPYAPMHGSK